VPSGRFFTARGACRRLGTLRSAVRDRRPWTGPVWGGLIVHTSERKP
jgi:hypothetical protein